MILKTTVHLSGGAGHWWIFTLLLCSLVNIQLLTPLLWWTVVKYLQIYTKKQGKPTECKFFMLIYRVSAWKWKEYPQVKYKMLLIFMLLKMECTFFIHLMIFILFLVLPGIICFPNNNLGYYNDDDIDGTFIFSTFSILTLYTLRSIFMFSILFSIHFLRCLQGEFV